MFFRIWALFFSSYYSYRIIEVFTLCFILGKRPCRLLLVARFMLSSIYLFIFLFFPNKFRHDCDWLRPWFPSSAVIKRVPFESLGFSLESDGFLSGFRVTFKFSIYLDKLCKERKELVTNPNSSTLLAFFSLWLVKILSSNLFYLT